MTGDAGLFTLNFLAGPSLSVVTDKSGEKKQQTNITDNKHQTIESNDFSHLIWEEALAT
jgi:hypothetical protein